MTPKDLLEKLLDLRGYKTQSERENFLNPKYADMHDPFLLHDMEKAVSRIFLAIERNEKICIYSDYDADGIPGAVILHDFFKKINYNNFCNYIPHRHDEGYGVHKDALAKLAHEGAKLVITVDVGITAVSEIEFGNSLGLDIIITDHHEPLETLPSAFAIVNPKLKTSPPTPLLGGEGSSYPDTMLCGSGVAFKLVQAMITHPQPPLIEGAATRVLQTIPDGWEKWLLDMAGLATLSDMVPLVNENRIIAYFGMKVLQKNQRPGLRALFEKSGIDLNHLTETDIVFSITPKLNAASRMAHPLDAFNALATTDKMSAMVAAEHLANLNDERKKIVARIMKDVHKKVTARKLAGDLKQILVIGDPSWPAGILGIIASKVLEEYNLTTFVWGSEEETIKGSCRGIGDVSVVKLMESISHVFVQFGGHSDAGGFSMTRETIHFLEEELCKNYDSVRPHPNPLLEGEGTERESNYDLELNLADVTVEHYKKIREMAPFGMGNKTPVFAFKNIQIESVRQFGKTNEHLEVMVRPPLQEGVGGVSDANPSPTLPQGKGAATIRAISWYSNPDSFSEKIEQGKTMTLLGEFDFSVFRGKSELRLKIVDFVSSGE